MKKIPLRRAWVSVTNKTDTNSFVENDRSRAADTEEHRIHDLEQTQNADGFHVAASFGDDVVVVVEIVDIDPAAVGDDGAGDVGDVEVALRVNRVGFSAPRQRVVSAVAI